MSTITYEDLVKKDVNGDKNKNDNYETKSNKLSTIGAEALIKSLDFIEKGNVKFIKQDISSVTKAPKISKNMLRIKWNWSAIKINNWIRGLSPNPGMITTFQNKTIKIFKSAIIDAHSKNTPGKIKFEKNNSLEIYTGKGLLSILELQQEGKKSLPVEQFLRGANIDEWDLFS